MFLSLFSPVGREAFLVPRLTVTVVFCPHTKER